MPSQPPSSLIAALPSVTPVLAVMSPCGADSTILFPFSVGFTRHESHVRGMAAGTILLVDECYVKSLVSGQYTIGGQVDLVGVRNLDRHSAAVTAQIKCLDGVGPADESNSRLVK